MSDGGGEHDGLSHVTIPQILDWKVSLIAQPDRNMPAVPRSFLMKWKCPAYWPAVLKAEEEDAAMEDGYVHSAFSWYASRIMVGNLGNLCQLLMDYQASVPILCGGTSDPEMLNNNQPDFN
eukprot:TRINITY_DN82678_c0_g1_i1.p1 TRINITY_DN82678_c0_g1~~TRINITY_DN82678_c0_g1_i1.p1  ORF type:complete len:121 (-),score=26.41 TRINITY_DN82678_c0_g1_i1:558-920(-)